MKLYYVIPLLALVAYAAVRYEDARIQQTCESDNAPTVLNGSVYVCLTSANWSAIRTILARTEHST